MMKERYNFIRDINEEKNKTIMEKIELIKSCKGHLSKQYDDFKKSISKIDRKLDPRSWCTGINLELKKIVSNHVDKIKSE